jgi:CubicO group peptidase (beta-lactamase class C family)
MKQFRFKYFSVFLAALIAIMVFGSCGEDPINVIKSNEEEFKMDKFESNLRASFNGTTVGYVYAINFNQQLSRSGDSGFARTPVDGNILQSASKRMNIASITKTITAVAVLQLLERRGLTIDSLIAPWLPADWVLGTGVNSLSFKSLLTHRTGFNTANNNFNLTLSFSALRDSVETGCINPQTHLYMNMNYALFRVIIPALWKGLPGAPAIGEINASSASFFYRLYIQQEIFDKIGVMNADCVNPSSEQATLFYTNAANTPGVDYGDWSMICGGGGYYLSAIDLANFMANIRYNNAILSPANREIMKNNYIGWSELGTLNGKYGEYFNHGGSINSSDPTGSNLGNMRGLIIQFPNKVELAVMVNSEILPDQSIRTVVLNAYDNAWE